MWDFGFTLVLFGVLGVLVLFVGFEGWFDLVWFCWEFWLGYCLIVLGWMVLLFRFNGLVGFCLYCFVVCV